MRILVIGLVIGLVIAAAAVLLLAFRLAPGDPVRWHVDPRSARPGEGRFVVRPEGGDVAGPLFDAAPEHVLEAFDRIALASPRTRRLAGSVAEGRLTYVSRSLVFGFPDYTTVEAAADGSGTRLVIFARARFGRSDLGVNRRRVTGWLDHLQRELPVVGDGA